MSDLAELLADCDAWGIRLHPAGDGGLTIDAPQAALTPDIVARLKAHKAELLALLRPAPAGQSPTHAHGEADDQADMPVRFDNLAGRSDSQRAIGAAGLQSLRAVH